MAGWKGAVKLSNEIGSACNVGFKMRRRKRAELATVRKFVSSMSRNLRDGSGSIWMDSMDGRELPYLLSSNERCLKVRRLTLDWHSSSRGLTASALTNHGLLLIEACAW